jgi:hypothetical protein
VITPDVYEPSLNPLYRDVLAHDRVVAPRAASGVVRWRSGEVRHRIISG